MEPDDNDQSSEVVLVCPQCDASVDYVDVQEAELDDHALCPECGCASPTDMWFA